MGMDKGGASRLFSSDRSVQTIVTQFSDGSVQTFADLSNTVVKDDYAVLCDIVIARAIEVLVDRVQDLAQNGASLDLQHPQPILEPISKAHFCRALPIFSQSCPSAEIGANANSQLCGARICCYSYRGLVPLLPPKMTQLATKTLIWVNKVRARTCVLTPWTI